MPIRLKRFLLDLLPRSIAGNLHSWRVARSIRRFPKRVVEHDYGGHRLKVCLADPLGEGWYDADWNALPEIISLRSHHLISGSRVLDAGAHQGVVAMMIAREVGPLGQVIAIEASRHNAAIAEENLRLNAISQVKLIHAAVSDSAGHITFIEGLNGQLDAGDASGGKSVQVEAVTVDTLADRYGHLDVVFIDVEGAECFALAGAKSVISVGADFFIEVHVNNGLEKLGGSVAKVISYFDPKRYHLEVRAEGDPAFRPMRVDDPIVANRFFLLATCRLPESNSASTV